jgi:hypothetical protein
MLPAAAVGIGALALYALQGPRNTIRMTGPDGQSYEMQNLPEKEKAVALMADIKNRLVKLYDHYKSDQALAADPPVRRFLERFNSDVFVENDMQSRDTSYSENKGQKIVVCLRDKTKAPQYPLIDANTIMFVILHEMAHLMTETIGHTQEFWSNFRRILGDASQLGLYSPVNYDAVLRNDHYGFSPVRGNGGPEVVH